MIITGSYFIKYPLMIANVADRAPNSDLVGNTVSIVNFINRYEPAILTQLLGYDLYAEFSTHFNINTVTGEWTLKAASVGTCWDWLLNGYEYTKAGVNVKWQGLIFKEGGSVNEIQRSLIAYYVYSKFIVETAVQNTMTGMQAEQSKNSTRVSANSEGAIAFNDFYQLAIGENYTNSSYYYEGFYSYLGGDGYKSLYDFLNDMNDEDGSCFVNWKPAKTFKLANRFGL